MEQSEAATSGGGARRLRAARPRLRPLPMVVATVDGPDPAAEALRRLGVIRVATKYPRVAAAHFERTGRQVEIIEVKGSVELAPLTGLVEAIVDLTATGTTLRENNLVIREEIAVCTARLIANPVAHKLKAAAIDDLLERSPCGLSAAARGRRASSSPRSARSCRAAPSVSARRRRDHRRGRGRGRRRGARATPRASTPTRRRPSGSAPRSSTARARRRSTRRCARASRSRSPTSPRSPGAARARGPRGRAAPGPPRRCCARSRSSAPRSTSPAARAPYPSTVVMGAVTARAAGVARRSSSRRRRRSTRSRSPPARSSASTEVYRMGGAQAIAALALGTETVEPVDVIVGPGNLYVQEAKRQLSDRVGIDGFAGPSDLVVLFDAPDAGSIRLVAHDLLAQAEHGEASLVVAVAPDGGAARRARGRPARAVGGPAGAVRARRGRLALGGARVRRRLRARAPRADRPRRGGARAARSQRRLRVRRLARARPRSATTSRARTTSCPTGGSARFASALDPRHFRRRMAEVRIDPRRSRR